MWLGIGKQRHARDAEIARLFRARDDAVDRPARDARQARDRLFDALTFDHEQRPDEIGRGQHGFGMEAAAPPGGAGAAEAEGGRSEEHTSELQSLMRISYAVFCL